jgi:hypothetical protein
MLPMSVTQAAPADLPETGQTTCSDATGTVVNCAGTGQDGDLRAGVAWPSPRFVVGSGATTDCVTDSLTGLMWVRAPGAVPAIWTNALASASNLELCGFGDWQLPNLNELESLLNLDVADPAAFLNSQGFSGVQSSAYWSSTSVAGAEPFSANAWLIHFDGSSSVGFTDKSISVLAWPVRTAQ